MPFFRLFKPKLALPPPRLRLVVFGTEETLPWPLQLTHPGGLWGALTGVPSIAQGCHRPLQLERPMGEGDYVFEGLDAAVIACVQQRHPGDPYPGRERPNHAHPFLGLGSLERDRLEAARWMVALEFTELLGSISDALLYGMELADRLAMLSEGVVLDQEARRYYLPGKWRLPNALKPMDAGEHVVVQLEERLPGAVWVHTHGLSKFGCLELEVRGLPANLGETASSLLLSLSQHLISGGGLRPGDRVGDFRAPLCLRLREDDLSGHYRAPFMELVDVGDDGKAVETGATCGLTLLALTWSARQAV